MCATLLNEKTWKIGATSRMSELQKLVGLFFFSFTIFQVRPEGAVRQPVQHPEGADRVAGAHQGPIRQLKQGEGEGTLDIVNLLCATISNCVETGKRRGEKNR